MFSNAEAYERFMGRWSKLLAPLLVDFANVPDSERVLDVGSGTGALAFEIARRRTGLHVVGIDPSDEYVAYASKGSPFPDRTTFQKGDAQALQFADAEFAASVSSLVFNFIPDPMKALREVRRVTKPKATVTAAVWDYGDGMRMLRVFWNAAVTLDSAADKMDEKHMRLCRSGELAQLWKDSGLDDVHEQPLEIAMKFDSFADYWDPFLLGQGPAGAYVRTLSRERVPVLRDEVKRRLSIRSANTPFTVPARVWAVRGRVPTSRTR